MVKGDTTTGQTVQHVNDGFLFFCVLAGCMVFHLFWCDSVRSGYRIGCRSDLRVVCSRCDALQVKPSFLFF